MRIYKRSTKQFFNYMFLICFVSFIYLIVIPPFNIHKDGNYIKVSTTDSVTDLPSPIRSTGLTHHITDFTEYEILTDVEINYITSRIIRDFGQITDRLLYTLAILVICISLSILLFYLKCFIRYPDQYKSVLIKARGGHAPPSQVICA